MWAMIVHQELWCLIFLADDGKIWAHISSGELHSPQEFKIVKGFHDNEAVCKTTAF